MKKRVNFSPVVVVALLALLPSVFGCTSSSVPLGTLGNASNALGNAPSNALLNAEASPAPAGKALIVYDSSDSNGLSQFITSAAVMVCNGATRSRFMVQIVSFDNQTDAKTLRVLYEGIPKSFEELMRPLHREMKRAKQRKAQGTNFATALAAVERYCREVGSTPVRVVILSDGGDTCPEADTLRAARSLAAVPAMQGMLIVPVLPDWRHRLTQGRLAPLAPRVQTAGDDDARQHIDAFFSTNPTPVQPAKLAH